MITKVVKLIVVALLVLMATISYINSFLIMVFDKNIDPPTSSTLWVAVGFIYAASAWVVIQWKEDEK